MNRDQRNALLRYEKERRRNLLAQAGVHDFIVVLDGLKASFNIPKIFRSAEAFGAREVHLVDIDPFDPAPAKGSFRKVPARFHESFADCYQSLRGQGYRMFALAPGKQAELDRTELPPKSAFIFGHEELGFSFELEDYPDLGLLSIPQFGQVQSFNVSIAASIVMYEYISQHRSTSTNPDFP